MIKPFLRNNKKTFRELMAGLQPHGSSSPQKQLAWVTKFTNLKFTTYNISPCSQAFLKCYKVCSAWFIVGKIPLVLKNCACLTKTF